MKAVVYEKYGPPEVFHLKEVEKSVPLVDESVTVPAGTFTATKCTVSQNMEQQQPGGSGIFKVKMQSSSPLDSAEMVLNSYG